MHDTVIIIIIMKKDIDFKAICKSLEQSPTENTNILLYQKANWTIIKTVPPVRN